jgi:hypothetical protein
MDADLRRWVHPGALPRLRSREGIATAEILGPVREIFIRRNLPYPRKSVSIRGCCLPFAPLREIFSFPIRGRSLREFAPPILAGCEYLLHASQRDTSLIPVGAGPIVGH